mmetsp:Transcript_737/g.1685  ORF Transcript_737/g.1685 Transcript_737/m.1685 type:complete len:561 (-) Transcript_737:43-1725(-)
MSDSSILFPLVATAGAVAAGSLALLQTDRVSRMILDPSRLNTKRRAEYQYTWKKSSTKTKLQLDYFLAGGIQKYDDDPEIVMKNTEYVSSEEGMDALVGKIVDKKETSVYYPLKLDKDPHDPTEEFYLYLLQQTDETRTLFQVPLVKFGMKLAQAFEDQLTSTTLCFVADGSAGKATSLLESLVKESKTGVAVVSEPFWMVQMARLMEASVFPSSKIKKVLFGLCRLDAWSVRNQIGDAKTVMITLPGQAVVRTLLPIVQSVFPEDRHVFCYDGCCASVKRGLHQENVYKKSQLLTTLEPIVRGMCSDPVRITTPLPSNSPLTKDLYNLEKSLAQVSVKEARNVETWMSSVDAYFKLKNEEDTNGYLPFCLKLGFLVGNPVGNFEDGTDSYWSLNSILQFVTGCQGRAFPEGVLDAAREWIKDYNVAYKTEQASIEASITMSEDDRVKIENCVFQHKQILIGNKTLQDTVLPKEHWTMKQASRNGCSCCGPDPYDLDEEEAEEAEDESPVTNNFGLGNINVTVSTKEPATSNTGLFMPTTKSTGYVDATKVFAFDPTRFS